MASAVTADSPTPGASDSKDGDAPEVGPQVVRKTVKLPATFTWQRLEKWDNEGGAESKYTRKVTRIVSINSQQVRDSVMSDLQKTSHDASVTANIKYSGFGLEASAGTSYNYNDANTLYSQTSFNVRAERSQVTTTEEERTVTIGAGKSASLWQLFYNGPGVSGGLDKFQTLAGAAALDEAPIKVTITFRVEHALPLTVEQAVAGGTFYLQNCLNNYVVWLDKEAATRSLLAGGRMGGGIDIENPDQRALWELTPASEPRDEFEYSLRNAGTSLLLAAHPSAESDTMHVTGGLRNGQGDRERWSITPGAGKYKGAYKLALEGRGTLINDAAGGESGVTKTAPNASPAGLYCYWRFLKPLPSVSKAVHGVTAGGAPAAAAE